MILSTCYPSALAFLLGPHNWVSPPLPTQGGGSDDTELRYSSQYEERLDPFSSFSKRVCEPGLRAGQGIRRTWPQPSPPPLSTSPGLFTEAQPHMYQMTRAACMPTSVPWRPRSTSGRPRAPETPA